MNDAETAMTARHHQRSSTVTNDPTITEYTTKVHPFINNSPNVGTNELRMKAKKPLQPLPRKRSLFDTEANMKFSPKHGSPKGQKTLTQSNFHMKKRSANVLGAGNLSRPSKLSSIDGGLVRHKLNINSYNSTQSKFMAPSTETYSVSNSSYLLGQSTAVDGGRPNIRVESLDLDEGIVYRGTFES